MFSKVFAAARDFGHALKKGSQQLAGRFRPCNRVITRCRGRCLAYKDPAVQGR